MNYGEQSSSVSTKDSPRFWLSLIPALIFLVLIYCGANNFLLLLSLVSILVHVITRIVYLILAIFFKSYRPLLVKEIKLTFLAIAFPALILTAGKTIERGLIYAAVKITESHLRQRVQQLPGQTFKYGRFRFGSNGEARRWIVYDESDQVLLPYKKRSREWWRTTQEDEEAVAACFYDATLLYSHFYLQYTNCR